MILTVNGQQKKFDSSPDLNVLIHMISKNPEHVIAELNGVIIKKNMWGKTPLSDGDTVELVTFVGGG